VADFVLLYCVCLVIDKAEPVSMKEYFHSTLITNTLKRRNVEVVVKFLDSDNNNLWGVVNDEVLLEQRHVLQAQMSAYIEQLKDLEVVDIDLIQHSNTMLSFVVPASTSFS
jgi:hypothetical protein